MKRNSMYYKSMIDAIGDTPLVKIPFNSPATILAKLEYLNPGGSVKDRSALYMIEQAEKKGLLKPGGTIIEASSGNQGIALAMMGVLKGYNVIITVSEKCSKEKYQTLKAYGARVVVCPSTKFIDDPQSYHMQARKLHDEIP
ncbi:MAG: pyridoxal-phosphate dependent enzyme, partial [Chitinophagia bacterium]|nr:pyridoxal-phosphate dependent enzyme [Chitinophagia bacterium]